MNPFATQMQTTAATLQQQQQTPSAMDVVPIREDDPLAETINTQQQLPPRPNVSNAQTLFNRTDFSIQKSAVQMNQSFGGQNHEMSFQTRNNTQNQFGQSNLQQTAPQMNRSMQSQHSVHQSQGSSGAQQNPLHTAHMEILHKQQTLKEPCELPFVVLSEDDEKRLFDLSVQLKFGDFRTVMIAVHQLTDNVVSDYPIEVLLQRTDIFKALLDLLEGGQTGEPGRSAQEAYTNLAQQAILVIVRKLKNVYRFIGNNTNKASRISSGNYSSLKQGPADGIGEVDNLEYLKLSYPGLKEGVWNTEEAMTDLKKYGAHLPSDRLAAASTQGSLSCKAALGLVLSKSIYLLKDTEKIGLYIQLIKESLDTLLQVFRVAGNPEFSEMLHLCLFAFDSVCEFYKDQIFEEILIQPIMDQITDFLRLINSIPSSVAERFKAPITETLFKNTERLQMTLRRAIFSTSQSDEANQVILDFFTRIENDLPQVNLLQKNVTASFKKAQNAYALFLKVHSYRLNGQNFEDMTFVDSMPQLAASVQILEDLTEVVEMKINFPFEHLLLDCMVYGNLVADQNPYDSRIDQIESLLITYLSLPYPEVRERFLRRLYQRLRVVQAFQTSQTPHQSNSSFLLSKFIYRKKVINQLVNGMLINAEVANEETKLQMSIGQLIIKSLIISYNEGGVVSLKQNSLNQFLLTFQALMPQYPELIGLIDLIEENAQRNCRFLRIIRDLFSQSKDKREFSTSVLASSLSKDFQNNGQDLLQSVVDIHQPSSDISGDLDLVNLNYDFTNFDIVNITSILQNATSDFAIRKSSLEQLTLLLFDCDQKRGKVLFTNQGVTDVFSFVLSEVLTAYKTAKTYLGEHVEELPSEQIGYLDQCLKFLFFAYTFFQEDPLVKGVFDKIRSFSSQITSQNNNSKYEELETILNALVFMSGSTKLRKHAMRLLYALVFHPLWLRVKITKTQAHAWRTKRSVTFLVPDFCQDTFVMLVPYQQQVVKMPMRDDLLLTQEQKHYILAMFNEENKRQGQQMILTQVSDAFVQSKGGQGRETDFNNVMRTFETLQNYLLSLSHASEELVTNEVLFTIQDLIRMLPTRDFEFNFLADFLMSLNQILTVCNNVHGSKQLEALVASLCEALKFHLLPYLFEVSISGLDQCICDTHNARIFFLHEFLEFMNCLSTVDTMLKVQCHVPSRFQERVLSTQLVNYLTDLYIVFKEKNNLRKKIQLFIFHIITSYDTSQISMEKILDLLISQVSQHRLSHSFEGSSLVLCSLRSLLVVYQQRLTHVDTSKVAELRGYSGGDLPHAAPLSHTAKKYLDDFTSSGWLIRFTESRDARMRVMAWDLLVEIFDYNFLMKNGSTAQQSLNVILRDGELYCVKISALKFLNKLCDSLIHNCENTQDVNDDIHDHMQDNRFSGSDAEHITVKQMLNIINKQGLISQIHGIFSQKDCPLLMISLLLRLLSRLIQMDSRRALPVLTQLDYWTVLVDLINVRSLEDQDKSESRGIMSSLRKMQLREIPYLYDQVYVTLNSIIEFIFEAFKRDGQLANLLVKTTKLLPSVFELLKYTLDNVATFKVPDMQANRNLPLRNKGLMTIFVDKIVKILHICLLHPRDYSVDMIGKFLTDRPLEDVDGSASRNWLYIIKMFKLIGSQHSSYFYGHIDVKLSICRFVSELLIRLPQSSCREHFLDETVRLFDGEKYMERGYVEDEKDIDTFGGLLLVEFGQVFRALYIDQHDQRATSGLPRQEGEHENSKIDISLCINILTASSQSAKVQAIDQNLFKKVMEICSENASALHLAELQRYTDKAAKSKPGHSQQMGKVSKEIFETQFKRKYKYADVSDLEMCEREVVRMMRVLRHIFFHSGALLTDQLNSQSTKNDQNFSSGKSFISQNAQTKVTSQVNKKSGTMGNKIMELFGTMLENLGGNSKFDKIIDETLMTMINYASQNVKFKNAFITQTSNLSQSRRTNVLRIVVERVMNLQHQTNRQEMRLLFGLLKSLALSAEVTKELMKSHAIDDLHGRLEPICKNEKDIKLLKHYLVHYSGFLAAFASTDDGQKAILKCKPVFETSLFIMDTVTPPSVASEQPEMTPLSNLLVNILLFLRNSSYNRSNKNHFLNDQAFLPCILAFISSRQQHPRVRAYATACLWSILYNHQGIKAAINTDNVRGELSLLKGEYQRQTDISTYAQYVTKKVEQNMPESSPMLNRTREAEMQANKRMDDFTLLGLTGVLNLLEA